MQILFNPTLGDRVTVSFKPSGLLPSPITIQFSATLSGSDFAELKRTGGKVQLWTNILQDGRSAQEWSEYNFLDETQDVVGYANSGDLGETVHLISEEEDRHAAEYDSECGYLRLRIPISTDVEMESQTLTSEFTYRIVYPSGEIKWLGHYGYNGTLVLENGKAGQIALNTLVGWAFNSSDASCTCNVSEGISGPARIAQFADPSAYQLWPFGDDDFLPHCQNASLILVIPRAPVLCALVMPNFYILSASSGALVSVDYSGNITTCGDGTVSVFTYSYGSTSAATSWISGHLQTRCRVAHIVSSGNDCALLAPDSLKKKTSRMLLILPLNFIPANQIVRIPYTFWSQLLGTDPSTPLAILSSNNLDIRFFRLPSSTGPAPDVDMHLTFLVGPSGSQFTASTAHFYASQSDTDKAFFVEWSAFIFCSCIFTESLDEDRTGSTLLTPPTTPPLESAELRRRIAHSKSTNFSRLAEPALSNEDVTGVKVDRHGRKDDTSESRAVVVRSHEMPANFGLFACINYFIAMAGVLLELFYVILFGKVQTTANPDADDEVEASKDPSLQPSILWESEKASPSSPSSGMASFAPQDTYCESTPDLIKNVSSRSRSDAKHKANDNTIIVQGIQARTDPRSHSLSQKSGPFSLQIGDKGSIMVAIKLRISTTDSDVDSSISPPETSEILKTVSLNGRTPQLSKIKNYQVGVNASILDHIYLLEFEGARGDWLDLTAPFAGVNM